VVNPRRGLVNLSVVNPRRGLVNLSVVNPDVELVNPQTARMARGTSAAPMPWLATAILPRTKSTTGPPVLPRRASSRSEPLALAAPPHRLAPVAPAPTQRFAPGVLPAELHDLYVLDASPFPADAVLPVEGDLLAGFALVLNDELSILELSLHVRAMVNAEVAGARADALRAEETRAVTFARQLAARDALLRARGRELAAEAAEHQSTIRKLAAMTDEHQSAIRKLAAKAAQAARAAKAAKGAQAAKAAKATKAAIRKLARRTSLVATRRRWLTACIAMGDNPPSGGVARPVGSRIGRAARRATRVGWSTRGRLRGVLSRGVRVDSAGNGYP